MQGQKSNEIGDGPHQSWSYANFALCGFLLQMSCGSTATEWQSKLLVLQYQSLTEKIQSSVTLFLTFKAWKIFADYSVPQKSKRSRK